MLNRKFIIKKKKVFIDADRKKLQNLNTSIVIKRKKKQTAPIRFQLAQRCS